MFSIKLYIFITLTSAAAFFWCFAFLNFIHATTHWAGILSVLLPASKERGQGGDIKRLAQGLLSSLYQS